MQVSTKTTVYMDGTELRDVIAAHLRREGVLPEGAKFAMHVRLGACVEQRDVGTYPGLKIENRDSARVTVEWPGQSATGGDAVRRVFEEKAAEHTGT